MCAGESHSILSLLGAYQISLADGVLFTNGIHLP